MSSNAAMKLFVIILLSLEAVKTSKAEDYNVTDISNTTEYLDNLTSNTEEIGNTEDFTPTKNQDTKNLRIYRGPLPKFPGTTISPWIALHSPVRMYIPIRNTGVDSAESVECIQCSKNLLVYLSPREKYILTPIPTISICPSFARQSGRVHVAVVSGPRPSQRLHAGRYQVELMVWKAEGTVHSCNYSITVKERRKATAPRKISCPKPEQPANGVILCDTKDKKYYSHNSVCQIFCLKNHLIENSTANSSTIVCKNGRWSQEDHVSCVAAFCPDVPHVPSHGSWICEADSTTGFQNGTVCKIICEPGYVIPSSQLAESAILCDPPSWNYSETVIDCKRALLPKIRDCHNRHIIVTEGHVLEITPELLPKATNHEGVELTPVCSLQKKNLSSGKHQNNCEVTDLELRTRQKCSYRIHIEESYGPHPHTGDCKNRTAFASRKGTLLLKPVRFVIKVGKPPQRTRVIRGSCDPKGEVGVGSHFVVCNATDPDTKATGTCSYWLLVRERTCSPLKDIHNGRVMCDSQAIGAVCSYECDSGFSIPSSHLSKSKKSCQSNMRWQPVQDPICEIKPPELLEGCNNLDVQLTASENFTVPLPRYVTPLNETLNVSCTPSILHAAGNYEVSCPIEDERFNVSCKFNVTILEEEEFITMASSPAYEAVEQPKLVEGCEDLEVNASAPINYTVPLPHFQIGQNITLNVSCSPNLLATAGYHNIMCIVDDVDFNSSCYFNVSIHEEESQISVEDTRKDSCKPLPPPIHGSMQCSTEGVIETCIVTCDTGYGFSEDNSLSTKCNHEADGLWDFQKASINNTLPGCFAQLEGSAVELWISFEAFAPHCEEEMEEQLKDLVNDLCVIGTDCSRVAVNCTLDEESDMMLMTVNWTVEADFNDEEYYEGEEIPEAEIRLESVMDRTRAFLAAENAPGSIQLFPDSFRRGLITLVCPNGFVPNMLMAKCVQCLNAMEHC